MQLKYDPKIFIGTNLADIVNIPLNERVSKQW